MGEKINIRETFLPDEGEIFVRVDESQIEDRMCKMYCGTERMIELANRHPEDYDAHTENAVMIFEKAFDEISKDERYYAKKTVHGSQRRLQGARMSESILKDTKGKKLIPPKRCDKMIHTYLDKMWEIEKIYFPWVERQIQNGGILYDSWGGRFDARGRKITNDLYREGYSWYLQVEAARWTNQYLYIPTHHYMWGVFGKPCSAQVHDEVIVSVPVTRSYEVAQFMVQSSEQTREIPRGSGNYIKVPATVTIGRSYGDKEAIEFKRLPHRDDFYQKLAEGGFFDG